MENATVPVAASTEERQARVEAFRRWRAGDEAALDDSPPGLDRAILQALNRKYRNSGPR